MKDRLPALDGLRGVAAFSVLLSHAGYSPAALVSTPLIIALYNTLRVGPNSVQILFVLSGFLMALLYPQIKSASSFIQKRYARILPIYITIVVFLWIINLEQLVTLWWVQMITLLTLAGLVFLLWKLMRNIPHIGKILFYSFIFLQSVLLVVGLVIVPHFVYGDVLVLPVHIKNLLILLSNITLTTPFAKDVPRMSIVFWSLAPELYFYLLYPFFVIPLIHLGKKYGYLMTIFIIVGVTKVLFDLDKEIVSIAGLQSINIARSSGFVAGVTVGTIYQTKGKWWEKIEPILKTPIYSIIALLLLFAIQWGDWSIRDGQSTLFMNLYYLASSWIIALIILAAIIPKSIAYRVLSNKILVFIGVVSFSLYLIHVEVIGWADKLAKTLQISYFSKGSNDLIYLLVVVILSIGTSFILFRLVEFLYFANKKPVLVTTLAKEGEGEVATRRLKIFTHPYIKILGISVLFFFLYTASFSPTQLLSRNSLGSNGFFTGETSLLHHKTQIPFTAEFNNISAVSFSLRYTKSASITQYTYKVPAKVVFTLLDTSGKQIAVSSQTAYLIEGHSRFGFGFPTVSDSKGKKYIAQLSLVNGREDDQVFIDQSNTSFVSIYTTSKQILLHSPWIFLLNKLVFALTNPRFLFALLFILLMSYLHKKSTIV